MNTLIIITMMGNTHTDRIQHTHQQALLLFNADNITIVQTNKDISTSTNNIITLFTSNNFIGSFH